VRSIEVAFNKAYTTGSELGYMEEAMTAMRLAGNGPFAKRCGSRLEELTATRRALLTHSATGALEMSTLLAGVGPGDEVIMPSFTFVSTANAVVLRGAVPVFVDVREDTLNIDERRVEDAITDRTRAIFVVHYAGVGAEMDCLAQVAAQHDLVLLEDAAQGLLSTYRGRPLGSFGDASALSFHETKNVTCGEGGALLVNRADWVDRAEIVHEKGTDRSRFFRGQVDKYTWVDAGSSFVLSELSAAFLWAQLQSVEEITRMRRAIWDGYAEALAPLEEQGDLRLPVVPETCVHNGHLYYVLLNDEVDRDRFIGSLAAAGVSAVFHYVPLHSSPAGERYGRVHGNMSVTERAGEKLVRLPLWAGMSPDEVAYVADAVARSLSNQAGVATQAT
jgi:dTDP-4-amino-4,6-dideoxygalactose transaminase